ncbi:hypothetical protein Y032_0466g1965 [Ancylostoma ceylanicum]|uniref:Uncharacterized protein n=1 Tax=Ancylostoma ceylanicum TaxID=53326 RepID=A0A016WXF5_9BILA|nr:hypothetical protein Y032_0466g1965 [Ancylostoma ceylanicum]
MAGDISDTELQLALELSKKTYEEEERRRNEVNDLIRFESPEAPIRREQINQIKRLYSQPSIEAPHATSRDDYLFLFNPNLLTGSTAQPHSSSCVPRHQLPVALSYSIDDPAYLSAGSSSSLPAAPPLPPKTYTSKGPFPPTPNLAPCELVRGLSAGGL